MQSLKFNQKMIDQASQWANDLGGIKNSITRGMVITQAGLVN